MALIIERFVSLKTAKITPPQLLEEALAVSRVSLPIPDVINQLHDNSALGEVLASGMRMLNSNPHCSEEELRSTMEGVGRQVAHRLERYLPAIATIASAAPLLGLLGTVIGMIEIFGAQSSGGAAGGGNPAQLAHGISVALYNTAFGLMVAIPALIFWRYFRARVDGYFAHPGAERRAHGPAFDCLARWQVSMPPRLSLRVLRCPPCGLSRLGAARRQTTCPHACHFVYCAAPHGGCCALGRPCGRQHAPTLATPCTALPGGALSLL
jgi:biopolymer transport protein ExbB